MTHEEIFYWITDSGERKPLDDLTQEELRQAVKESARMYDQSMETIRRMRKFAEKRRDG